MVTLEKTIAIIDSGFTFNPSTGDLFSLNPVGLDILGFLKEGRSYDVGKMFIRYSLDMIVNMKEFEAISTTGKLGKNPNLQQI